MTTPGGTSATSPADLFYYAAPGALAPKVSGISPSVGPVSGGTLVTISGSGFDPTTPTAVYFGSTAATNVNVLSPTSITAESPAATGAGAVDVTVITFGGASLTSPADVFTYSLDGPQVTIVKRYGYRFQPTYVAISFDSALDRSHAQNVANYQIVGPGGRRFKVSSAIYNSGTQTVTLALAQRLVVRKTYRLRINGTTSSGITNTSGLLLDGAGTGQPGSNYVTSFSKRDLAGSASQRPVAAFVRARAKALFQHAKSAFHRHVK